MERAYFLGLRLRNIYDLIITDVKQYYNLQEIKFEPRWFPLIFLLRDGSVLSVTEIAREIGQSHVAIVQLAAILEKKGLISTKKDHKDNRRRLLYLSPKGKETVERLTPVWDHILDATRSLLDENAPDFLNQLSKLEEALIAESLLDRINKSAHKNIFSIIGYEDKYRGDFQRLNEQWLEKYFGKIEQSDIDLLTNPQKILDQGGEIFFARNRETITGTFCLIKYNRDSMELAKLAVHEGYRHKGIGGALVEKAISRARALKAKKLVLYTSPLLVAANNLYHLKGFTQIENDEPGKYIRQSIKMQKNLIEG
ncbi:MAG TPA: bifunctional helix-turn-helix transcriptional regulator/GNAT family N-acetyltransferase [Gillisia sp.]|nr:bifunctional helix-turn-helix transcriptional regulator/GNAT family N-acetyltransferase [Gillisia sp.]